MEKNHGELARRIEQVVREFLVESRAAAVAAVEQRFVSEGLASTGSRARPTRAKRRPAAAPRARAEIEAIRERFMQAVLQQPGESMQTFARLLGESSADLYRYCVPLKEHGLIRTVGKLQSTRYFPLVKAATTP